MWAGSASAQPFKDHGQLLSELCGPKKWLLADSFWLELLSFPVPLTKFSPTDLVSAASPYCEKLREVSLALQFMACSLWTARYRVCCAKQVLLAASSCLTSALLIHEAASAMIIVHTSQDASHTFGHLLGR